MHCNHHFYSAPLTWIRDILGPLISPLLSQWIYFLPCLLTQQEILEEFLQGPASMDVTKTVILLGYQNMATSPTDKHTSRLQTNGNET